MNPQITIEPFRFPNPSSKDARSYDLWKPDVHLTGGLGDPLEVRFIESLMDQFGDSVVAHQIYSPYLGTYSVEMQFGESDNDRQMMRACLEEYRAAFDQDGILKKAVAVRFAMNGPFKLIVVRPAMEPELVGIEAKDFDNTVNKILDCRHWEYVRYPDHLKLPLTILINEYGALTPTAYNRWGIVGGFVVTRITASGSKLSLTDKQIKTVMNDLSDTADGLLNPASMVECPFSEPFAIHGIPPSGWIPPAGRWFGSNQHQGA